MQQTPQPTPVATIGPGAYFEASDTNRPDIEYIEGGDEQFGYGPVEGYPGLYAMWTTDENGTHYFLTDEGSEQLFGTIDPLTQNRREDGFVHFIQQRDDKVKEIEDKESDVLAE